MEYFLQERLKEDKKFKNKINYADKLKIPFVVIIGEDEVNNGYVTVKDMFNFNQEKVDNENDNDANDNVDADVVSYCCGSKLRLDKSRQCFCGRILQ